MVDKRQDPCSGRTFFAAYSAVPKPRDSKKVQEVHFQHHQRAAGVTAAEGLMQEEAIGENGKREGAMSDGTSCVPQNPGTSGYTGCHRCGSLYHRHAECGARGGETEEEKKSLMMREVHKWIDERGADWV